MKSTEPRWVPHPAKCGARAARRWGRAGWRGAGARIGALLLVAVVLLLAGGPEAADQEPATPPPSVELDRLLRLPDSFSGSAQRRGGATRLEWLERFRAARLAVSEAEAKLRRAEQELDDLAGDSSSWNVAPPGATNPQAGPLNYRLLQEIRRFREEADGAKKELRALEVRADLAGVPAAWRASQGS